MKLKTVFAAALVASGLVAVGQASAQIIDRAAVNVLDH